MKDDILKKGINIQSSAGQSEDLINTRKRTMTEPFIEPFHNDIDDSILSYQSLASIVSSNTNKTIQSVPFQNEKDLDLPEFGSTKYNSFQWRFFHFVIFILFGVLSLISTFLFIFGKNDADLIVKLISHALLMIYIFMLWFHFKRGCWGSANLNSSIKDNVDKSCKARLLRIEEGMKYFFSLIGAIILLFGSIYYKASQLDEDADLWNISFIGWAIITLIQILKFEKILTENKHYVVRNDIFNCIAEILLFFGSLSFGTVFFIQTMYNHDTERFKLLFIILKFIGSLFMIGSSLTMFYRYFLSDFDDLNSSDISNVTIY